MILDQLPENLVALFKEYSFLGSNPNFVAGGPCICFAKGNPERLLLQDLIDCSVPSIVAAHLKLPVFIYLQTFESDLMKDVIGFTSEDTNYNKMQQYLQKGLAVVLKAIGLKPPEITFLNTMEPKISSIIDKIACKLRKQIDTDKLFGLYAVNKVSCYPHGTPEEDIMLSVYYRNLALYYPEFFAQFTSLAPESRYLIVENLTQMKAIRLAKSSIRKFHLEYILYPSTPNRQGKEMCLGNRNHKIELRSTKTQVNDRSKQLMCDCSPYKEFYVSLFGKLKIVEVMDLWKSSLAESTARY